ncbi:MAG: hypothetical protein CMK59_08080 [Proteobacteria bacterium]|nr:hypothetical protein [Pseudomonadota bacterium]
MDLQILNIEQYWSIPNAPAIEEICQRMNHALCPDYHADSMPLRLKQGKSIQDCLKEAGQLPYLEELEALYGRDLSWIRVRLGEEQLLAKDKVWLTLGDLVMFASKRPSRSDTNRAVYKLLKDRKLI